MDQSGLRYRCVLLDGELDRAAGRDHEPEFTAAMHNDVNVVVDLRKVPAIDSSGIRLLLSQARTHADQGGKTVLMGMDARTRRIFKTTGMDHLVPVCNEIDEALSRF